MIVVAVVAVIVACAVVAGILRRRSAYRRAVDDLRVATEDLAVQVGAALRPAVEAMVAAVDRFVRRVAP